MSLSNSKIHVLKPRNRQRKDIILGRLRHDRDEIEDVVVIVKYKGDESTECWSSFNNEEACWWMDVHKRERGKAKCPMFPRKHR